MNQNSLHYNEGVPSYANGVFHPMKATPDEKMNKIMNALHVNP